MLENITIQIVDAKTHEDITRSVLLQIISKKSRAAPMFTYDVLTQIIRFYGHAMQGLMGNYLEKNLQIFTQMQERLQEQTKAVYGDNPIANTYMWGDFLKFQAPAMRACSPAIWNSQPICSSICSSSCRIGRATCSAVSVSPAIE